MTATEPKHASTEGQATVELALVLPVVVLLALALMQAALVARDHVLVVHAARAAAREAAVRPRPEAAVAARVEAIRAAPALKPSRLSTETSYPGGSPGIVTVRVRYQASTDLPLIGPLIPDVEVVAKAAFRDEIGH